MFSIIIVIIIITTIIIIFFLLLLLQLLLGKRYTIFVNGILGYNLLKGKALFNLYHKYASKYHSRI